MSFYKRKTEFSKIWLNLKSRKYPKEQKLSRKFIRKIPKSFIWSIYNFREKDCILINECTYNSWHGTLDSKPLWCIIRPIERATLKKKIANSDNIWVLAVIMGRFCLPTRTRYTRWIHAPITLVRGIQI